MRNDKVYREQQLRNRIGEDTMAITAETAIELLAKFVVFAAITEFATNIPATDASAVGFPIANAQSDYSYTVIVFLILIGFMFGWAANSAFIKARNWLTKFASVSPVPESKDEPAVETDIDDDKIPVHLTAAGRARITKTICEVHRSTYQSMPAKCHYYSTGKTIHLFKTCAGNFGGRCTPVGIMSICFHCRRQLASNVSSDFPDSVTK
jgi:uncharacterized membrane protein YciS (DUF1049 family)